MIPGMWYAILESGEVPKDKPTAVERLGKRLVLWRDDAGVVACVEERCPHRGAALGAGRVADGHIECPFHGFRFDGGGACTRVPCSGVATPPSSAIRAAALITSEANGFIYAWTGGPDAELPEPPFFSDIGPDFAYASAREPWDAHYARLVENQLDVAHLPFVHRTTIGRGDRTLVDGPALQWLDDNRFRVYPRNRVDDGTPPKRPADLGVPDQPFHLEFVFPNLWQNYLGEATRVLAAFVPVDDERSVLYLRFYRRRGRLKPLGGLFTRLAMPLNVVIARQDRRVVETQVPKRPVLRSGEKLVQADLPIVAYRRRREELIAVADPAGRATQTAPS